MLNRDFGHYYGEVQVDPSVTPESFCYTGTVKPLPIMLGKVRGKAKVGQSWQQTHST